MLNAQRFSFVEARDELGDIDAVPRLPLTLQYRGPIVEASGLLDTGAGINVLPCSLGVQLGAVWDELTTSIQLAGNLAPTEARGLIISAQVGEFAPVRLVFAWSLTNDVPLLLGRTNFLLEFDVCFYASQKIFEVRLKS